ncbi:MAG: DUF1648 domain-containing protein [Ruminococcaceae bacterium]|nr:DUF1648 domain-containing protein [Oscillospiraceae bacterium]
MWKNHKKRIILTTVVCLLPMVVGLLLWDRLPLEMAIHFNAANEPDNWASRGFTVLGMPAIIAALHLVCLFATAQDPKNKNLNSKMMVLMLWICPFISWLCAGMTLGYALGRVNNIGSVVSVFLGILFMVIGNYMPKCTPSYTIGIKLPWTLHDEDNWRYTHRIGGFCFTAAGLIVLVASFFGTIWLMAAALAVAVIIPVAASFLYYKKHA